METSNDKYHFGEQVNNPAWIANEAAKKLCLKTSTICIDNPTEAAEKQMAKGEPVYQGSPKMRGRAVDKLTGNLPVKPKESFTECPFEDLRNPRRIHLDAFGNAHLCQGISMGNVWETPLSSLIKDYDPDQHPVCGPILRGGPLALANTYNIQVDDECVDACHFCTKTCIDLLDRCP